MFLDIPKGKKAIMGVSTLIIFVTAILVAAVAASVIVRTVGLLEERAVTVGTEVRNRIVTAVDFISITAYNNLTTEKTYGVTMLIRARAGSYAYDLLTAGLLATNNKGTFTAQLQHSSNEDLNYVLPTVGNLTAIEIVDIDKDKRPELARVNTIAGDDQLEILFSRTGVYGYADLGADISSGTSVNLTVEDVPIITTDGRWLGFLQATGNASLSTLSPANATVNITRYPLLDFCSFETLRPNDAFCYEVQLGNTDAAITKGELYKIYFKFREPDSLETDEPFEFKFIPKKGDVTSAVGSMPDSLVRESGQIWPTSIQD